MTKDGLFEVLKLLDQNNIRYWIEGGWGVDILIGGQTRELQDLDIDFDEIQTDMLLNILHENAFTVTNDSFPVRMELRHPQWGNIDIHPIIVNPAGSARQADGSGGYYELKSEYFGEATFGRRVIRCISFEGQLVFHTGYEPRPWDIHDVSLLNKIKTQQ